MEQFEDLLVRILLLAACISFVSFRPFFLSSMLWNYTEISTEYNIRLPQMVIVYLGIKMERYRRLLHPYLDKTKKKRKEKKHAAEERMLRPVRF